MFWKKWPPIDITRKYEKLFTVAFNRKFYYDNVIKMKNKCHICCRELSQLQHIKIWAQLDQRFVRYKTKLDLTFDLHLHNQDGLIWTWCFYVIWLSGHTPYAHEIWAIYDEWLWRYEWSCENTKWRLDDVMVGWSGWKGYCIHSSSGQRYCENWKWLLIPFLRYLKHKIHTEREKKICKDVITCYE